MILTSKGVKEGPKGPKNVFFQFFAGNIESNRSLSGVGRSRPSRGEVEGVKTDPGRARGGPSRTETGPLWPKLHGVFSKISVHHLGDPCHYALYTYELMGSI